MPFAPDFGLHFQKTMGEDSIFDWAETEIIGIDRIATEHYTFSCNIKQGDVYATTFDFGKLQAEQLVQSAIPPAKEWLIAFFSQEFIKPSSLDLFKFPVRVGLQAHLTVLMYFALKRYLTAIRKRQEKLLMNWTCIRRHF